MADTGNAVVAEWVGPSGHQLFDGTRLEAGIIVKGIGYDESKDNPYWKVLGDLDTWNGDADSAVASHRSDPTFDTEEGGEATGRPVTDAQRQAEAEAKALPKHKSHKTADSAPTGETPTGGAE